MFLKNFKYCVKFYILFVAHFIWKPVQSNYLEDNYPKSVIEDANLDTAQLIQKYQYPVETHYITTEDNYILCLHRIPKPKAPPVFLMHGLQDSSSGWILTGPDKALGYYLFDNGYDVWMGNARGNRYSRNHTLLNPDTDVEFWKFSWHEIGFFDLPASIDYALSQTGYNKIGYFGNSQGTESFWVCCSMHPEYNDKITMMHAITPAPFRKHIKTSLLGVIRFLTAQFKQYVVELLRHTYRFHQICHASRLTEEICVGAMHLIIGSYDGQINKSIYPTLFGHFPSGSSLKQLDHYLQLVTSNGFRQYDYGKTENFKRYGKSVPPLYPLEKITAPVGLYYTYNDYLSSEVDVKQLVNMLPNVVEDHLYPYKKWNHATLIYGNDVKELAYKRMLEVMKNYPYG